ncbi:MAG: sialate O-acetylesterase [Candidatus Kapabacteria bacterium]|jgi:hypothetical protein|nr:sialate O-acetylesterase [Candidatus Kapabacteria bacterium]
MSFFTTGFLYSVLLFVVWCTLSITFFAQPIFAQGKLSKKAQEAQALWSRAMLNYQFAMQNKFAITSANFRASFEDFSSVIEIAPTFAEAYFMRSLVGFSLRKIDDAFIDAKEVVRLKPSFANLHPPFLVTTVADSLAFEGILAFAAKNFVKADSLFSLPETQVNMRSMEMMYLYKAIAQYNIGKQQKGCEDCRKAVEWGIPNADKFTEYLCNADSVVLAKDFPVSMQFFPRDKNDSAQIILRGLVRRSDADSVVLEQYRNGKPIHRESILLKFVEPKKKSPLSSLGVLGTYIGQQNAEKQTTPKHTTNKKNLPSTKSLQAEFSMPMPIKAECAEYSFKLSLKLGNGGYSMIATRDSLIAGDVFLFAGQSNMVLGDVPQSTKQEFIRTYNTQQDRLWQTMSATNVMPFSMGHIGALGGRIAQRIVEEQGIPVCAIHAAESGTSIEEHFPTYGSDRRLIFDRAYRLARNAGLAAKLRGIVWYQGESNTGLGYTQRFSQLYAAWKQAYPAFERIHVIQIRQNQCNEFDQNDIRDEQRRFPEVLPKISVIASNGVEGYDGCHFSQSGFLQLGDLVYASVAHDYYASTDTIDVISPTINRAYFEDSAKTRLVLDFVPSLSSIIPSTTDSVKVLDKYFFLKDAFALSGRHAINGGVFLDSRAEILGVEINSTNRVVLTLRSGVIAETVSYLPDKTYTGTSVFYNGPWLTTKRGAGVLAFYRFKIQQ